MLDLQAALTRVYDLGAYPMRIDYNRDPIPPAWRRPMGKQPGACRGRAKAAGFSRPGQWT